jgi:hypothetical protein
MLHMAPRDANVETFAIIRASALANLCRTRHQLKVQCKKSKISLREWNELVRILRNTHSPLVPELDALYIELFPQSSSTCSCRGSPTSL